MKRLPFILVFSLFIFADMHELSIALSIVDMASEEAARLGGVPVNSVHLKLGALSGVVKDALLFSYEVACKGTPLEGSRLVIEEVSVVIYCPECQAEKTLESIHQFCCPSCGTLTSEIIRGRELEFTAMEIQERQQPETIDELEELVL